MVECPQCKYKLTVAKAVFCPNCGVPIITTTEEIKGLDRVKLWGGESRILTVFFIQFNGFEKILSRSSAQVFILRIRKYFTEVENIINNHKGTAQQIIPDNRVIAIFGAPRAQSDDCLRAVRCAWDIRKWWRVQQEKNTTPDGLSITIGINTGRAFFGFLLEKFLTVIGDMINTAARITEVCPLNEIVISDSTYQKVLKYFEVEHIGGRSVKGKSKKINIYRVSGIKTRVKTVFSQKFPICGREEELKRLTELAQKIKANNEIFCIISGQMGIGKTRLKEEFEKILATQDAINFFETNCSTEIQTPFYAFKFLIKKYSGINENDDNQTVIKKISEFTREHNLSEYDREGLSALFLSELQRLSQDEIHSLNEKIFAAVRNFIQSRCSEKPLVLIFEEFNRADELSRKLIVYLSAELKNYPVMFLMINAATDLLSDIKLPIEDINLNPLTIAQVHKLLAYILGNVDEKVVDFIYEAAGGNPLFTIEAIRNTRRTKLIKEISGKWQLTKTQRLSFLDDLYGVVMSTIDSLPSDYRLLIDYASVIGYTFSLRILSSLFDNTDLEHQLHYLIEEGYIVLSKDGQDPVYVFRHNLLKDAAYTVLPLRKRKEIHRTVAKLFEQLYAERISDFYENIGHHYLMGENYKKAAIYHKLAGDKAKNLYALEQALQQYDLVLKLNQDSDGKVGSELISDILLNRADIYEIIGDVDKMRKSAEQGLKIVREKGALDQEIDFIERYSYALLLAAQFDRAEEQLLSAVERGQHRPEMLAVLYADLGLLYQNKYEYEKSVINYNLSWNTLQHSAHEKAQTPCLYNLSQLHQILGNYEQALEYLDFGLTEVISDTELRWQVRFNYARAEITRDLGALKTAEQLFVESLEKAEEIGNIEVVLKAALDLGVIKAQHREYDEARRYLALADKKVSLMIRENLLSIINLKKALIYYHTGEHKRSQDFLRNALTNAERYRQNIVRFNVYLLSSLLDQGQRLEHTQRALEIAELLKAPPLIARALSRLTTIYREAADLEKARYYGRKALFVYDDIKFKLTQEHQKVFVENSEYKSLFEI